MSASPHSPLDITDDAFKASRLERMLANFTASYKLYFLKAIFDVAVSDEAYASYELLAARMVAYAWYPVLYFRLNLGATDQLANAVDSTHRQLGLSRSASYDEVVTAILSSDDRDLMRQLALLCRYVPHRLLRPFYEDRFAAERALTGPIKDSRVNSLIAQFNKEDSAGAPYTFEHDGRGIVIDNGWARYLSDNKNVIQGWLDMKLVDYLQRRNPSVPAIPLKIRPPLQRNLAEARSWWSGAIADHQFREVYSGIPFEGTAFDEKGPLSVDHFIPWSFVLHDHPWNLLPVFRDTNSSKSDRLPNLDKYLSGFCTQQFDALLTLRSRREHRKVVDDYLSIDPSIMEYEQSERSLDAFSKSVSRLVTPLHQIAANQGFPLWAA